MIFTLQTDGQNYRIDLEKPINIAVPLDFHGLQPNAYDVEKALSKPCEAGTIVGDTRRGGSCNFEQITFIPHCNGTHTECVGHITYERIAVHDCLTDALFPAVLISVLPENASETTETYSIGLNETDKLITRKSLQDALQKCETENSKFKIQNSQSLILRTLPNDESKLSKTYAEEIPPFFSLEAIKFISELNIKHLLVDVPSIDRIYDEGKLSNHRAFWRVEQGSFEVNEESLINNTITEMIFVSSKIADGFYLLNLQIAPFVADAAPSRPVLFQIFD